MVVVVVVVVVVVIFLVPFPLRPAYNGTYLF